MTRSSCRRRPKHGRWTLGALLDGWPRGEHGADLEMMKHEGMFPLYPAERCVTRIKMLEVVPPGPPLKVIGRP